MDERTMTSTVIRAFSGSVTVTRTLYGEVSPERYAREKKSAQRQAEQLDLRKAEKLKQRQYLEQPVFDPDEFYYDE